MVVPSVPLAHAGEESLYLLVPLIPGMLLWLRARFARYARNRPTAGAKVVTNRPGGHDRRR